MEAVEKVEKHIADAVAKRGAKVLTGGKRHTLGGTFFEPTVLANVAPDSSCAQEETFGPLAPVFRFKDRAGRSSRIANTLAVRACVHISTPRSSVACGASRKRWSPAWSASTTGLITTEVAPFGGVKESGLGREGSRARHG
jgi:succinate-semialdehyde dehydrogenase/glutarate-semialdehyde dehydrogenase